MEHGCEDIQRLIAERSERALLPGEDAAVSRHLADCPACREFLRSHDELLHLFVAEFSRVPAALLSSSLAERVMARLPVRPGLPARQAEPELQPVAWRPRGRLRRLFGAPALAAAAVLVCAVLGWLFLGGTPEARLERWDPAVAWRVSAAADWRVADRPVALGIGRALYVPPGSHAQLRLGDGGTVLISDDAAFEPLAAGPHLGWGHALVRPADSAPVALDTPLGRVEMDEGGEFFLELSRPDACLDARRVVAAPAATTDLVVWSLRGTARVRTGERETRVATGESRAFVPGGPPCALSAYEIRRLARQLEAAGQAPGRSSLRLAPSAPLAASLADTIRGDDEDKRVTAVIAGGRLGLEAIVRQAAATAREPQVSPTFRREVVQAVIRSGGADAGGMLAAFLADADAAVRELAARGLGRLGVAHAAPQLQALAAKEADPVAAHGAADALARLAVPIAAERQAELALRSERRRAEEALLAVETEVLRAMPEAIETVGRYLLDPRSDREVRVLAINMLVSVKDTRIERFLTRAIGDADTIVRRRALGSLGDRFYSVRPLPADVLERVRRIALAESTEPLERAAALRALVSRGGGSAPELERIVRSAHLPARVRLEAARGWAKLAKASALEYEQLFAAVDAEMGPPEEVLVELIHFYGSDAASPDKSWVVRQLDDERPAVGIAARRALHALTQRGVSFTPAEIDALRLRLPRIASEDLRVQLVAFIAGVLEPEEERLAFLRGILSGGSVGEMQAAIAQLSRLGSSAAVAVLRTLLQHPDPHILASVAGALTWIGPAGSAAVPDLDVLLRQAREFDPKTDREHTFRIARALLFLGETGSALDVFEDLIQRGSDRAPQAVLDIHHALGPDAAAPVLVKYGGRPEQDVRLNIARCFAPGVPMAVHTQVCAWWQREKDSWTRFALAFALVDDDRTAALIELQRFRDAMPPVRRQELARMAGFQSFDALVARVSDSARPLSREVREGVTRFIDKRATEVRTFPWQTSRTELSPAVSVARQLHTFGEGWLDRVRRVRMGLWSTDPQQRWVAAVNARAVLDPALVDALLDRLEDPESAVRRAAAEALARIAPEALRDFDPSAEGALLSDQAAAVRKAFRTLDLEARIPPPLPLALAGR